MILNLSKPFSAFSRHFLFSLWLCCVSAPLYGAEEPAQPLYARERVSIARAQGPLELMLEVAQSPQQVQHGLMYRTHLAEKEGMIFLFNDERPVDFWMKNTPIPLDMLFIDRHGVITRIVENAEPENTRHIPSGGPVLSVIELAGGSAKRLNIAKGDKVIYRWFHD